MGDGAGAAERGITLLNLGRSVEAEQQFRAALAASPEDADLQVYLAQSLLQQQRYAEARDAAAQGLNSAPEHVGGLLVISAALAGLRDYTAALQAVRRGLQIAPGLSELHRQEGALLMAQDRSADALEPLSRARTLDPENSDVVALLAAALFNLRRYRDAEQAVADALRLDPDNAEAHRVRGLLSLRRGGGRDAVSAHRQALRLDPTSAEYREGLATAMKTRNPLYGLLLRLSEWQRTLPNGARWLVLLAPLVATRLLRPLSEQLWAQILLVLIVATVLLMWTLEPLMNTVLLCSAYSRNLLPRDTKLATYAFLAYIALATTSVIVGLMSGFTALLVVSLGLGIWSISAGQSHLVAESRKKMALWLQAAGATIAVATLAAALLDSSAAAPLVGLLVLSGIGAIWFTALA